MEPKCVQEVSRMGLRGLLWRSLVTSVDLQEFINVWKKMAVEHHYKPLTTARSAGNVVMAAVHSEGMALEYACEELRADRDVVMAAM